MRGAAALRGAGSGATDTGEATSLIVVQEDVHTRHVHGRNYI